MWNSAVLTAKAFRLIARSVADTFQVPANQITRIFFHGAILSSIIAGFWLLDSLKDPILSNTVGIEYQPMAKLLSVITTLFIVCIYDFLTSLVSKPTLFHIVSSFFGMCMMTISALLNDPAVGLTTSDKGPHRILGWVAYFVIETYGSLMVALFWSFTNSIMDLEQAKGAYGLIIATAQIGAIIGSTLATNAPTFGIPQLVLVSALQMFSISLLVKIYHLVFRDHVTQSVQTRVRSMSEASDQSHNNMLLSTVQAHLEEDIQSLNIEEAEVLIQSSKSIVKEKTPSLTQSLYKVFGGFFDGIILISKYPYTLKILGVSCLYEIVVTVLDFQFKLMGVHSVENHYIDSSKSMNKEESDQFANLLGHFGQFTNFLSFLVSFFGFSYLVHHIGVRSSLMIFPTLLLIAVLLNNFLPKLYILFVVVSILKALIFSLHDPVKELLYMPTSEAIKFKAKAWIDVFGSRFAKAAGALISASAHGDAERLRMVSEVPCILLTIMVVLITFSCGTEFRKLVESNTIVGDELQTATYTVDFNGPLTRKGLKPGDVGYDGYDLHLFDGVFEEDLGIENDPRSDSENVDQR